MLDPSLLEELEILEELDRRRARDSFLAFYMRMTGFLPPPHIRLICRLIQSMEEDLIDRGMVFAPPRHGKTLLCTKLAPAWLIGRTPTAKMMSVVHTADYAGKTGRAVRNLLRHPAWPFDGVILAEDSQAREQWATPQGGEYNGFGATAGNQHGNPAEWLFMDDLVKGRKIAMSAHMRQEIWENYTTDLLSRLEGRAKQLMVFCLAGDTGVLMADGTEKHLRDVRPGDCIATYEKGRIRKSKVLNSANQGPDQVFEIKMTSGRIVKANARHPFLVKSDGGEEWRRTDMLRKGDLIRSVIGVSGAGLSVRRMAAESQPDAEATAQAIMRRPAGLRGTRLPAGHEKITANGRSDTDTASRSRTMTGCSQPKVESAQSAKEHHAKDQSRIAETGFASTIATTPARSGACCATSATSPSATLETKKPSSPQQPTYEVADDRIAEIVPAGTEDVFDIQVADTENFIANGLVSHNTRWHMDDPAGRILGDDFDGRTGWHQDRVTGEKWFVLCLPAVSERDDDPLGRAPGEWLWPERFGEERLGGMRRRGGWRWAALFQQRPSPEEGLMFTKDHIARFDWHKLDRTRLQFYLTSDYAVTAEGEGSSDDPDYTVHMVWAVDPEHNIYLMDIWRGRTSSDTWIMEWLKLVRRWKPLRAFEEQGQIIKSVGPLIRMMMQKHKTFVDRVQLTSATDKATRAQALLGMASMGMMFLPEHSTFPAHARPHLEAFERELLQFPTAKHDDTVDAATLFGRGIHRVITGQAPGGKPSSPHGDTLDDLFSRHDEEMDRRDRQ